MSATYRDRLAELVRDRDIMAQFAAMSEGLKAVQGFSTADSLRFAIALAFRATTTNPELVAEVLANPIPPEKTADTGSASTALALVLVALVGLFAVFVLGLFGAFSGVVL
jgi:hypothetical protein